MHHHHTMTYARKHTTHAYVNLESPSGLAEVRSEEIKVLVVEQYDLQ